MSVNAKEEEGVQVSMMDCEETIPILPGFRILAHSGWDRYNINSYM